MSDVDISPDVVERAAKMIEKMPEVDVAILDYQEVEVSALLRALSAALTATQEKLAAAQEACRIGAAAIATLREEKHNLLEELTTAQAQIEAARNDMEAAALWYERMEEFYEDKATYGNAEKLKGLAKEAADNAVRVRTLFKDNSNE